MQFSVGDKVMHPRFGAGEITGETHRELVAGFEHYYVIKIHDTGATAYIPVRKMGELGVRPVMSRSKLKQVLDTLRSVPRRLSKDFRKRQDRIREMLRTGRPIPVAEAVRDLTCHGQRANLTKKDEDLLSQGRERLAVEIAAVSDGEVFEAQETIDAALKVAVENGFEQPERAAEVGAALTSA